MADVRTKSLGRPVLYALILLGVYLTYLVLRPFFAALTWSVLFAILFRKMQVALAAKMGSQRAALLTTIVIGLAIVTPAVFLISMAAREVPRVAEQLQQTSHGVPSQVQRIWDFVRAHSPGELPEDPRMLVADGGRRVLSFLAPRAGAVLSDFVGMLGTLGVMLFALFFMLRDGDAMRRQLRDRLPFTEEESDRLIEDTRDLVMASIGASVAVALAQGTIGGLAFWLLGIGSPLFWGVVTSFASLMPVVGASLVWVPASIGLMLSGDIWRGVAMAAIGVFGISGVDNVLRPMLLSGKTSTSGLVIFFGLLGGAAAFGLIGLVIGPIILVMTARLLEDLRHPELLDESARPVERIAAAGKR